MQLLINIINQIQNFNRPISIIYMNYNTSQLLEEIIENLSDDNYYYFSSLGLNSILLVIDINLEDNTFYFG